MVGLTFRTCLSIKIELFFCVLVFFKNKMKLVLRIRRGSEVKRPDAISLRLTLRGRGLLQRAVVGTAATSEPLPSSKKYLVQVL